MREISGDVPGGGASIYEVKGRLLIRTVDGSDSLGIERNETVVIDGYPDVDAETLGRAVVAAVDQAREVPRPTTWPKLAEYAAPLLAASPGSYRSYRAWQREARHVSVTRRSKEWEIYRWRADLTRGSWGPAEAGGQDQRISAQGRLPRDAESAEVGTTVLALLAEAPGRQ
jgi:hypothetical protein